MNQSKRMNDITAIEIAVSINRGSISGFHRYIRVNDFIVDIIEQQVVMMAWPLMERGAFPIREAQDRLAEFF